MKKDQIIFDLIEKEYQHPIVTKDGVTVANHIFLEDPIENLGAKVIKESAARTADEAGDGTTTSTLLAQSKTFCNLNIPRSSYKGSPFPTFLPNTTISEKRKKV